MGFEQTPFPTCLNKQKAYLSTQPSFLSAFMVRKSLKRKTVKCKNVQQRKCHLYFLSLFRPLFLTTLSGTNATVYIAAKRLVG